jgi:hypothetical protein
VEWYREVQVVGLGSGGVRKGGEQKMTSLSLVPGLPCKWFHPLALGA